MSAGALLVVGVAPASAATYHSSAGSVSASFTFTGSRYSPQDSTLEVTVARHVVYDSRVKTSLCGTKCWAVAPSGAALGNPLTIAHLGPGDADVVLSLYSGGAHCCYVDLVLAPGSAGHYGAHQLDLGDPGARLEILKGSPDAVFVTADDDFAYAFDFYAASGLPLKILRFESGHFVNVTRSYPALLRADAARWLKAFDLTAKAQYADSTGVIAAWAADEYLLGRVAQADAFLHQQAAAGHLNDSLNPSLHGERFVTTLLKFLPRQGY